MDNQAVINSQKKYWHIVCLSIVICTLFFTKIVFAEQYKLKLMVDLSKVNGASTDALWLKPIINPTNGHGLFAAQDNGLIYLTDKGATNSSKTILDLAEKGNDPTFISLTAMTLHPSFTELGKTGYATLYTAHTTKFNQKANNNRLTLRDTNIEFAFETVITAWQYDFDKQKIELNTQREVLRIPIKTQDSAIQHLSFDPYQKSWNTDYGQLYISLKNRNELMSHPLYSGVILRIYPQIFGARNYTVPKTNPFIKDPKINDEIVVMGAQDIGYFFWAKNHHTSIFIQQNHSQQPSLSETKMGDNLLIQSQSSSLWQPPTAMSSILLYQGRNFLALRNKIVFLTLIDNQWHLASLALTPLSDESTTFDKLVDIESLSPPSHLNIYQENQDEIILFDNNNSKMYSLQPTHSKVMEASVSQLNTTAVKSNSYVWYISLFMGSLLLVIFVYRKNTNKEDSISLLNNDHLQFQYEPTTRTVLLFKYNQKNVQKKLNLGEIIRCEVLLNNNIIKIVAPQPENALSNQNEVEIRDLFTKEHNNKMVEGEVRQITMVLSDKDESHTACLYLRKGNNRVTGIKYYQVIDILLDLCWEISKRLSPTTTEIRIAPTIKLSPVPARQSTESRPTRHDNVNKPIKKPVTSTTTSAKPENQATPQTDVIDGLDKLVNLHQKGYLNDEEFNLAKTKLLR